jgi:hypothetical protein
MEKKKKRGILKPSNLSYFKRAGFRGLDNVESKRKGARMIIT